MRNESLSANLRTMYDDMIEAYEEAKENENRAGQERIAKHIASLSKQIKEQEIHERKVIPVDEVTKFNAVVGTVVGDTLKRYDGEVMDASSVILEVCAQIDIVSESELGVDQWQT